MSHVHEHDIVDEPRVPGDIIGHILIRGWLIFVAMCFIIQGCNSKLLSSLRHYRKLPLFPSISGVTFWASLGLSQLPFHLAVAVAALLIIAASVAFVLLGTLVFTILWRIAE